jgi:hypothetical protein
VARSRLAFAVLSLLIVGAMATAQAQAVTSTASKVELTQQSDGAPALKGEVSKFSGQVLVAGIECLGTDENGVMGKNPSGTVKVSASNMPETEISCSSGTGNSVALKNMTISKTGAVTLNLNGIFHADTGCTYRVTKLTGALGVANQLSGLEVAGTAHLRSNESSFKGCAKTTPAHGFEGVSNASFENYDVTFM